MREKENTPFRITFDAVCKSHWMVSSGSPARRPALEELDATIRDLHRKQWKREERRGKEGDGEARRKRRGFIYPANRRLTDRQV